MPEPPPQQTQSPKPPAQPPHHGPEHRGRPWKVEGGRTPSPPPRTPPPAGTPQPFGRRLLWILLALLALNWVVASLLQDTQPRATVPYSFFRDQALVGNIKEVSSKGETIKGEFRRETRHPPDEGRTTRYFETERPAFADDEILDLLLRKKVEISAKSPDEGSLLTTFLVGLVPTLLIVGLLVFAMRRATMAQGGGGMLGNLGKSKARRYDASQTRVTFADVAGIDEATEELAEVVDFLRHPDRYRRLGGTIPHGVLLTGPPGTGKTLLARALAGEAAVPFYSLSASEFVEMIVGVGASRVRDLFEHAKQDAPSIIFIDELDAIGRVRGAGNLGGGSDEREQTLNQLLTEMDGFDGSEGVVVVSATNRPEILDPALLRAGRFDRRVAVSPPDQDGRRRILEVHTRSVPLADDVDLGAIAAITPGMVGADLRNLVNEAALHAARRDSAVVERPDFTDALEKIVLGTARRIVLTYEDRRLTAYHESGHALLGMLEPGADPVRKVSIIPRGSAMGVTFQSPEADRYGYTAGYLRGRIVGALGGRAAEELVFGEVTTGAESDLEQATAIARQMVGRWGMSDAVGLVSVLPGPGQEGIVLPGSPSAGSEHTRELVDDEVRRIIDGCYRQALQRLREHREQLDALAAALLEHETLDEADAYRAAGLPHEPAQDRPGPVPGPVV